MKLIFWQNILSFHQSAFIRALAAMGHSVTIVAEQGVPLPLQELGWNVPDFGVAHVLVAPDEKKISSLVYENIDKTVHVIGGLRGYSLGRRVFNACRSAGARMGFLSEGADPRGVKGIARRMVYATERIRYGRDVDFILAMGQKGVSWYQGCGWPLGRIFPFIYTTELPSPDDTNCCSGSSAGRFEIIYVGRLIRLKRVDILLRALGRMPEANWNLIVVGDGPLRVEHETLARNLGVDDRTQFLGALPNRQVSGLIADCDILILPSRGDGWGAVINEALMRGVPAVCTDRCGASDLLRDYWRGEVFPADSVDALSGILQRRILGGKKTPELSKRIRVWSRNIEGHKAAGYFADVLEHIYQGADCPVPPWYETN